MSFIIICLLFSTRLDRPRHEFSSLVMGGNVTLAEQSVPYLSQGEKLHAGGVERDTIYQSGCRIHLFFWGQGGFSLCFFVVFELWWGERNSKGRDVVR